MPDTKEKVPKGMGRTYMSIFSNLQVYAAKWDVDDSKTRGFSEEEINAVSSAEVVASEYGKSVCFSMYGGGRTYIPLSNTSTLGVGDSVDMHRAKILTLHRAGSDDINRIEI